MKYYVEESLSNFHFWSGGKDHAELLTSEQLDLVEQMMEEIEPVDGWSDTAINDLFWFDFDTICEWLGYKNEENLEKDVSNDDIQEAEDWAEDMSEDYDNLFLVSGLNKDEYIFEDNDGNEDIDCYAATNDFMEWWNNMNDFEKVEQYSKYQSDEDEKEVENATLKRNL